MNQLISLKNGFKIPVFGLGTWLSPLAQTKQAVLTALKNDYRCIDTAYLYQNEEAIGSALKEASKSGMVRRDDVFITTKIWNTFRKREDVPKCLSRSLKALQLENVDLLLIHFPFAFQPGEELLPMSADGKLLTTDTDYLETYEAMEKLVDEGLTRYIGLSNFNVPQIQRVLDNCRIRPVMVQNEISARCRGEKVVDFCHANDIAVTAYTSLGNPGFETSDKMLPLLEEPDVKKIAEKHGKSPAQVLLRYIVERGLCAIPKSVTPERIISNSKIFDFKLSAEDMNTLNNMKQRKVVLFPELKDHKHYPFHDELEWEKDYPQVADPKPKKYTLN